MSEQDKELNELKNRLANVLVEINENKAKQARIALLWARDRVPTPLAERLELECELTELNADKAQIEAELCLLKTQREHKPENQAYLADLGSALIAVCNELGREDIILTAKQRMKGTVTK